MWTHLDAGVGAGFRSCEEGVVDRVEGDSESAVDYSTTDMDAKVDAEDVFVLENDILDSSIGRPVRGDVVDAETCGKAHTSLESIACLEARVANKCPDTFLNLVGELRHGDARLCDLLDLRADLAMDFGGLAVVAEEVLIHVV